MLLLSPRAVRDVEVMIMITWRNQLKLIILLPRLSFCNNLCLSWFYHFSLVHVHDSDKKMYCKEQPTATAAPRPTKRPSDYRGSRASDFAATRRSR